MNDATATIVRPDRAVGTVTTLKVWKGWRTAVHEVDGITYTYEVGPNADRWVGEFVTAYWVQYARPVAVEYR